MSRSQTRALSRARADLSVRFAWLVVLAHRHAPILSAHDQIPGAPQTQPILIRGGVDSHRRWARHRRRARCYSRTAGLRRVGKSVDQPEDAIVIDGSGRHVYPGLIESVTDLGLREISAVEETDDRTEFGSENPNARAWVAVNPDSELIPVARAGGVLVAMTAPRGRWLRGQAAVIQLDGWTVAEMTLLAPAGLYVDWSAVHPRDDDDAKRRQATRREAGGVRFVARPGPSLQASTRGSTRSNADQCATRESPAAGRRRASADRRGRPAIGD